MNQLQSYNTGTDIEQVLRQKLSTKPMCPYKISDAFAALISNVNLPSDLAKKYLATCHHMDSDPKDTKISSEQKYAVSLFTIEYDASTRDKTPFNIVNNILRSGNGETISRISEYLLFLLSALQHLEMTSSQSAGKLYNVISLGNYVDIGQWLAPERTFTCNEFIRLYTEDEVADLVKEMRRPLVIEFTGNFRFCDISVFSLTYEETRVIPPGALLKVLGSNPERPNTVTIQVCETRPPLSSDICRRFEESINRPFQECLLKANFWNTVNKEGITNQIAKQCSDVYDTHLSDIHKKYLVTKCEGMAIIATTLDYGVYHGSNEPFMMLNKALQGNSIPPDMKDFTRLLSSALENVEMKKPPRRAYRVKRMSDINFEKTYTTRGFITAYGSLEEAEDFYTGSDVVLITISGNYIAYDLEPFMLNGESLILIPPMTTFNVIRSKDFSGKVNVTFDGVRTDRNFMHMLK